MPGLLELCRDLFHTDDLYKILEIQKTSTSKEVKRGYHKISLRVHPDRVTEADKEEATKKFQVLGKIYSILSDKDKRALFDESGEVDDEDDVDQDRDWSEYWRLLFKKVSVQDIKEYEQKYKGSKEELDDLKMWYIEFEGDMDEILDNMMCSTSEDEPRYTHILTDLINKNELPDFPTFTRETKQKKSARSKRAQAEAEEAEVAAKSLGIGDHDSLQALIQRKQKSREEQMDSFMANLEAKYAQPKKKKSN